MRFDAILPGLLKEIFDKNCLEKYCNFVVNLGHSLGERSNGISYVNLEIFTVEGKPSVLMRELYCGCVLLLCVRKREDTV